MIQDLEYALGEVELKNGIPDIEFTKVRHVFQKVLLLQLHWHKYLLNEYY